MLKHPTLVMSLREHGDIKKNPWILPVPFHVMGNIKALNNNYFIIIEVLFCYLCYSQSQTTAAIFIHCFDTRMINALSSPAAPPWRHAMWPRVEWMYGRVHAMRMRCLLLMLPLWELIAGLMIPFHFCTIFILFTLSLFHAHRRHKAQQTHRHSTVHKTHGLFQGLTFGLIEFRWLKLNSRRSWI